MPLPLFQVDAFTDKPFTGNPAAVCLCPGAFPAEAVMQQVAAEMNLSETAFLVRHDGSNATGSNATGSNATGSNATGSNATGNSAPSASGAFDLRWFTPTQEVDLCGHATLASAHVLWSEGYAPPDAEITFHTRSGELAAHRLGASDANENDAGEGNAGEGSAGEPWIELDFPVEPVEACEAPAGLTGALGADPDFTGRNRMDVLALFESEAAVRALDPDFRRLKEIDRVAGSPVRGIIATAPARPGASYDFASRFFCPGVGIDEDPVTGSAHCALAPFWAERLGQTRLVGRQVSKRGGTVRCEPRGEPSDPHHRVALAGQAVTVLRGELET